MYSIKTKSLLLSLLVQQRNAQTSQQSDVSNVLNYLMQTQGKFAMQGRSYSDGIIDLGKDAPNGLPPFRTDCQDALSIAVSAYYTDCSFPGRQAVASSNEKIINNWIAPICTNAACAAISYDNEGSLTDSCGTSKEVYSDNGVLTGLNAQFFLSYRLEKQGKASEICGMNRNGVNCAASVINVNQTTNNQSFSDAYFTGASFISAVGNCNAQCIYKIQNRVCGTCFNKFNAFVQKSSYQSFAPLIAEVLNVQNENEFDAFQQFMSDFDQFM